MYDDNNRCTQVKKNSYVYGEIDYDKGVVIMDDEEAKVSFNSDLTQGRATIACPMFAYRPKKNAPSAFTASGGEFI